MPSLHSEAALAPRCIVCRRPRRVSAVGLCVPCAKSYEETDGGDMLSVVRWAVDRARYFDTRRTSQQRGRLVESIRKELGIDDDEATEIKVLSTMARVLRFANGHRP